ncbi:MAG: glycoside hydrolase family 127 protein, partial [Verrucomicrobiota bacterium]
YCIEAADQSAVAINHLTLPAAAELHAEARPGLLGGITVLTGKAMDESSHPFSLTAIPYYAWANREKGPMSVWIGQDTKH